MHRRLPFAPRFGVRTAALCAGIALLAFVLAPLRVAADGLPLPQAPVPRALLHADGDGNRIFDDLEVRLKRADPATPVPTLVLFDIPLAQLDLAGLRRRVGAFPISNRFPREAAIGARLTPAQVRALAGQPHVAHVEGDDWVSVARETAVPSFGVTQARNDYKLTGDGDGDPDTYSAADYTIAMVDTGIDAGHADFAHGKIIGWVDYVNGRSDPYDDMGHGTHVASIAAGRLRDGVSGVAPGAALVGVKVMNQEGGAHTGNVVKGLDWCMENRDRFGIRVINLSVSGIGSGDGTDIMSRAIHACVDAGMVVCVAAGNYGPSTYTVPAPGASPDAITVGTMIDPGKGGFALWTTSSRGPTADGRTKPDLVAPGYQIMAAKAGTLTENVTMSGSSMATPFVAGVCALMLQANPSLAPADIKAILRQTAVDFGPPGEDVDYGAGRLDAYAALQAAEPPANRGAGTGPAVPDHHFFSGTLDADGHDEMTIEVGETRDAIAAVLVAADWTASEPIDYQLRLVDPDGQIVAAVAEEQRTQLLRFQPRKPGTYTLLIDSTSGPSSYFLDASFDGPATTQGRKR
jgi:serine protease AprX